MNRDDISRMAREAGLIWWTSHQMPLLERFAALVAAAEREACAKVADEHTPEKHNGEPLATHVVGRKIAAAIRARSQS